VLRQDNADKARRVADEKGLSAAELAHIQSVTTVPGRHAEFLLVQQTPHSLRTMRLLSASTPLKYAFTANSPEDRRTIQAYLQEGLSRPDAVRRFAREHPRGIFSSHAGKASR